MAEPWPRRALREPLLHFAVLGTAVFGLGTLAAGEDDDAATIVVSRQTQERAAAELQARLGRPPSEAERAEAIDRFVDGELLYREGLALGLDRDDPVVRKRVIQKMEFVGTNLELPDEPDEPTLRAFMQANPERYAGPPRYDFVLVTLPRTADDTDDARAQQVLRDLRGGADPKAVGGRFASGRTFSAANLAGTYGPDVAAAVTASAPGQWGMVASDRAFSLVQLQAVHPGEMPPFEKVHNRVSLDWKASQRGAALRQLLTELRQRTTVTLEP